MSDDIFKRMSRRRKNINKENIEVNKAEDDNGDNVKQVKDDNSSIRSIKKRHSRQTSETSDTNKNGETAADSFISRKHRSKSRELLDNIKNEDPNVVVQEINELKDKISEKLKVKKMEQQEQETDKPGEVDESEDRKEKRKRDIISSLGADDVDTARSGRFNRSSPAASLLVSTRLQRIREKTEETLREEGERSYRLKGSYRRKDQNTRFDKNDGLDESKSDIVESERSFTGKRRFKKAAETIVKDKIRLPSKEEQYDFFCAQWQPEKDQKSFKKPIEDIKTDQAPEGPKEETEAEKVDEKTKLIDLDDEWRDIIYVKALYVAHELQKTRENKFYFIPDSTNVPLKRKLGENVERARYVQDEGFFVGKKPYVTLTNRNLMENRLINMPDNKGLSWFGVDGNIIALPNPIKYVSTRPSIPIVIDTLIETNYRKALVTKYDSNKIYGGLNDTGKYRIDIDINKIEFSYHHLFSTEHVLAYKLRSMYLHHREIEEQNLIKILTEKLNALKIAEAKLKQNIGENTNRAKNILSKSNTIKTNRSENDEEVNDLKRLTAYKYEIQKTRQERNKHMRMYKTLTEKIIDTWKEIKELRQKQQFKTTEVKLVIKKKETDKRKEEEELRKEINDEFEETRELKLDEYENAMEEYNNLYKKWKSQQNRKKEAQKREEARKNNEIDPKDKEFLESSEERDKLILKEEDLIKPEKPTELDENELFKKIEGEYMKIFKEPGHPILSFQLIYESNVTPTEQCSVIEKTRRDVLTRTRIYVKIMFNNKLVYTTTRLPLNHDFTVEWGQIFNIYMIYWPESIVLQIFELCESRGVLKPKEVLISEIILPIPDNNCTCKNYTLESYEFSSTNEYFVRNKDNKYDNYTQSGYLLASASWGIDEDDNVLMPPTIKANNYLMKTLQNYDAITALGISRMQDISQLAKWIVKSNLDPNDPRNADLINLIRSVSGSNSLDMFEGFSLPKYFRLDQLTEEFGFVKDETLFENDRRFKLIELRNQEEPEFRNAKMIPSTSRLVPRDTFDGYNKRKLQESQIGDTKEDNEIESRRLAGKQLMQRLRENILKKFRHTQHQKHISDMIVEETIPNLTVLGHIFWNIYVEPRRPLYPTRKERKKITGQNVVAEDVFILLNIASAYDLPIRKEKMSNDPVKVIIDAATGKSRKIHEKIAGESLISPFVEVTFQKTVIRTAVADGPNATWNEEIRLPFKPPNNDFSPSSLQKCADIIYINVYDQIEVDLLEDDRDQGHIVHKQIQRNWLGSLKIPFSTLYFNSRVDGTFKLDTPPIVLGYTRDNRLSRVQTYSAIDNMQAYDKPITDCSYLTVFMTIEPQLLVPEVLYQTHDSTEDPAFLERAVIWSTKLSSQHPNRQFKTTVMDVSGKTVFLTRFLRPIKPPEELIENGDASFETAQNIARFVYLIPFMSDTLLFPGLCDIWSTCDQFMQILYGDEEEHAVLLTNLFLGLGKKAWLVLGNSITEGDSAFCMSVENNEYAIWYGGKPYKVKEPHNPVRLIKALVNVDNIWANIQAYDEPYRISFDINNKKFWQPFFTRPSETRPPSIQPEQLKFFTTDQKYARELETKIEAKLREKIQEWRSRFVTRWHRNCSAALRQILTKMEKLHDDAFNTDPEELESILASYKMCGFPINIPYTTINAIYDAVFATQVHSVQRSDIEFALAVHIHPYPNTILSIWIYIASLTRKK